MPREEHRLIIRSLLDLDAECSCGRWSMLSPSTSRDTDETMRRRATEEHERHAARANARNQTLNPNG